MKDTSKRLVELTTDMKSIECEMEKDILYIDETISNNYQLLKKQFNTIEVC